ncbi:MAG: hypothetical protein AAF772_20860 [Acidobacteriota bacterium]
MPADLSSAFARAPRECDRRFLSRRRSAWLIASLALLMLFSGCLDAFQRRPDKSPIHALWISPGAGGVPDPSQTAQLREVGVQEFFVDAATLADAGDGTLDRMSLPDLPPETPVTLVVGGSTIDLDESRRDAIADRLAEQTQQLRFDAESRGLIPIGVHLDLIDVADRVAYGAFLARVRKAMDRTLFLSVSMGRGWTEDPDLAELTTSVDFVVPFLHGQRIQEPEVKDAWDFVELRRRVERLEAVGARYLVGVITIGTATHITRGGQVRARTTGLSLRDLLWDRRLKLKTGFSLEGVNRQVYTVEAERNLDVGTWKLKGSDAIRVVRTATAHVQDLAQMLGEDMRPAGYLGLLFYRMPAEAERLSLPISSLIRGLQATPVEPELRLDASIQRSTGRGYMVRFSLLNLNDEFSELSLMQNNYVQVQLREGRFGRVKIGDFYRYDLFREQADGTLKRGFRAADVLRLYIPVVEGSANLTTDDIEVLLDGPPIFDLSVDFILPDGRTLAYGPLTWRNGSIEGQEALPEPTTTEPEAR